MTFSIVAQDTQTGQLGVGAVTGIPGVGKLLTWATAGIGAVATQGWINPYLGIDAIAMLGTGHPAGRALQAVTALDDGRDLRQVGVVDATGRAAAWTGHDLEPYAGDVQGGGWTVQGNLLKNVATLQACAEGFESCEGEPLVERLIRALEAGEHAGGDIRGARSATVYVVATEHYPLWDIRIDDSDTPLKDLRHLQERFAEELIPHIRALPTRENIAGRAVAPEERIGLV